MIDAETHQVLGLLPERDTATLAPWLAAHQDMVKSRKRQLPSKLNPFKPSLADRWAATDGNVTVLNLHREIPARGFRGHYSLVRDWIRRELPQRDGFTPAPPPPSTRQVTGWLTRRSAILTEEEKLHHKAVLDRCPELASAAELTNSFAEMLTTLTGACLPEWITEANDAGLPGISSFAADRDLPWASHVHPAQPVLLPAAALPRRPPRRCPDPGPHVQQDVPRSAHGRVAHRPLPPRLQTRTRPAGELLEGASAIG
ncbi:hypothetical protein ACWEKM_13475 [Streptomyces sp. NPDC004752]